ncbi:MAG: hypothetical protein COU29_02490 [Candidatus Magasanikbacteria bacterium CG10_big_fil_rev_8_21_14_0_10_36_32]|uniref:Uncharacterized protein n=1 Tax=Candidatus Magasanikbacteria bacterium CG10_big_fil_rev_8_21_14_0_10_36_32 TaxID=1974646 RepID=A0A2M6W733_9BACT|nr:MAG: hypothetical protein COU29_02490 [Candidatus Magasanikbacteria bacterium CG10_big_fil_rev_8_21_14_0_10_36_32]
MTEINKVNDKNGFVPKAFCDGTEVFFSFKKKTVEHTVGYFILAPSGAGKTHFVKNQKENHWIDGDHLWIATNAHPDREWWLESTVSMDEIDQMSDIITMQAKKIGLWVTGASNNWLPPDAVVLPDWRTHKSFIVKREKENYDGGAKSSDFKQVLGHRAYIKKIARKHKTPIFKSMEDAANYLQNKYKEKL